MQSDRFIPARSVMDLDYCHDVATEVASRRAIPAHNDTVDSHSRAQYRKLLAANFLHGNASFFGSRPLLGIRVSTLLTSNAVQMGGGLHIFRCPGISYPVLPRETTAVSKATGPDRDIPSSPTCIVDAPALRDDYYLSLMAWGTNDILAIALDQSVFLYSPAKGVVGELEACTLPTDYVTSVAWVGGSNTSRAPQGSTNQLAIGTFLAELQLWDTATFTKLRSLRGHHVARIGAVAWRDGNMLASGSEDTTIQLNDMRADRPIVATLEQHEGEVCGLEWAPDSHTLASGGNDNRLCLWDHAMVRSQAMSSPRSVHRDHTAAVKALAWSPWERHVLASGGGTADGTIKLWDSSSSQLLRSVATESQVCALIWSNTTKELLSAHGHCSRANQLSLWQYPSMTCIRELTGHTERVLHLAMAPDGSTVASAGADETLRFWRVFPPSRKASPTSRSSGISTCLGLYDNVIR
ncbi:hypothetical protein BBJ28_00003082 [Nothophytophthora sp. Chile5]|nr:hypothetical protein BBJ28_00003082 [Nothophytophthora sp. Chile5]